MERTVKIYGVGLITVNKEIKVVSINFTHRLSQDKFYGLVLKCPISVFISILSGYPYFRTNFSDHFGKRASFLSATGVCSLN